MNKIKTEGKKDETPSVKLLSKTVNEELLGRVVGGDSGTIRRRL
jgi:hypothetical protein